MGGGIIRSDFYEIVPHKDGLVDVYLIPSGTVYTTEDWHDVDLCAVRSAEPSPGLEVNIRTRYSDWCEAGEFRR